MLSCAQLLVHLSLLFTFDQRAFDVIFFQIVFEITLILIAVAWQCQINNSKTNNNNACNVRFSGLVFDPQVIYSDTANCTISFDGDLQEFVRINAIACDAMLTYIDHTFTLITSNKPEDPFQRKLDNSIPQSLNFILRISNFIGSLILQLIFLFSFLLTYYSLPENFLLS